MGTALIIIDVQNDYFPDGKCELYHPNQALNEIKRLLDYFRNLNRPIFFVQHIADENASFFIPNTKGVKIHENITPLLSEIVIKKHYPNSFLKTTLLSQLQYRQTTELVVCGMMTHMCVDTTVRASKDLGYEVTLISNACATKELSWNGTYIPAQTVQNVYLASLKDKFAHIMTCQEYIDNRTPVK